MKITTKQLKALIESIAKASNYFPYVPGEMYDFYLSNDLGMDGIFVSTDPIPGFSDHVECVVLAKITEPNTGATILHLENEELAQDAKLILLP